MYQNIATGQQLSDCDFFAYISSINWCNCGTDEVWINNNQAKNGQGWFMYFQSNPPSCADQAPTCMAPIINHAQHVGETLSVTSYSAIGIPTPTKSYQWQESIDNITFTDIVGAIGVNLAIISAYVGKYIRVKGTATNGIGLPAVCYSSARLIEPALAAPTNVLAPVISGSTTQGSILTCTTGTWNGYPAPSLTYNWYANGIQVGTGNSYQLKLADSQKNITCVVTASNGINPNASATSNTIVAGDFSPQNTSAPVISGGTALGSQLTCSPGSWNGTGISFSYQWLSGLNPVGDDSAQYQLQITDTLANITCIVTASNLAGSNFATSNTITANDYSPINIVAPIIHVIGGGSANPGEILECNVGTWIGSNLQFTYQWLRGALPVGTNSSTYQVVVADTGASMTCVVTATNLGGSGSATSNNINVPSGPGVSPPSNNTLPVISVAGGGSPIVGSTIVANVGTWNGTSPISYQYQWYSNLTPVGNDPYYIVQPSDYGDVITCQIIATNAYGTDQATSNSLTAIGSAPINVNPPSIVGGNTPGDILSINLGTWNASPSVSSYNYLWQYSQDGGATWNNYSPSQITATKIVLTSDIGKLIRCFITANNAAGTGNAYTNYLLIDSVPINTAAPVISGPTLVGSILTTTNGTWTGSGTITYSYRWLRNGVPIVGEITNSYTTVAADAGANIQSEVTASNGIGPGIKTSNVIVPTIAPTSTAGPIIYGSYSLGSTLFVYNGYYSAFPAVSITRVWQLSTDGGLTWNNIVGATGTTYVVQSGDVGNQIRVVETATNGILPNAQSTSNVATITAIPVQRPDNSVAPTLSGNPYIGQTLTTTNGTWLNSPTTFSYQWFRENRFGNASPVAISGAITNSYTLVSADTNFIITCRVTASNSGGNEIAISSEVYAYDADFYNVILYAVANSIPVPTIAQQQHFSRLVRELKDNSMWAINDRFYMMAQNGSSDFGRINWMSPSAGTMLQLLATTGPIPVYLSNFGYLLNGAQQFISTQFTPSVNGVNYQLNNAGRYAFLMTRTASQGVNYTVDGNATQNNNYRRLVTSAQNEVKINGTASLAAALFTNHIGYHCITRADASNINNFQDTPTINTQAQPSVSLPTEVQWIGRNGNTAFYGGYIGWYAIGSAIPVAQLINHRNIITRYMSNL